MAVAPSLLILVDALRYDYADSSMPFLSSLVKEGFSASVIETCAFQTRPAYLAGLEPDESDICHLFQRTLEHSHFDFTRPFLPLLRGLDESMVDGLLRRVLKRIARVRARNRGEYAAAEVMDTARIPLHLLHQFALSEVRHTDDPHVFPGRETLFDKIRARGLTYQWIGYPRHYGSSSVILNAVRNAPKADLTYIHLSELDWVGHRFGPESQEMKEARESMDSILRDLADPVLHAGGKVAIFGDHGMVEVRGLFDARTLVESRCLVKGEGPLCFFDSTQIRLWYPSREIQEKSRDSLKNNSHGHLLSTEERRRLHLNFSHNRYGDDIFVVNGGLIVHPSYFERTHPPKGMHGYLPDVVDNRALVVTAGGSTRRSPDAPIAMVELFSLFLDLFDLR